jgi:hypothetical protein
MPECLELVHFADGWFQDYRLVAETDLAAWVEIHIDRSTQYIDQVALRAAILAAVKPIEAGIWYKATTDRYVRIQPMLGAAKTGSMVYAGTQIKAIETRKSVNIDLPDIWGRIGVNMWVYLGGWVRL